MGDRVTERKDDTGMKRRSVVRGTAWAVPTIVIGSAAPAMAASRPPGLQGWVTVGKNCQYGNDTLTINGTGGGNANPPNSNSRGLWVFNTNASTTISNAVITFWYPTSRTGTITWQAAGGNSNWSVPVVSTVGGTIPGFTGYTTYYSGGWQYYDNPGVLDDHHRAIDRPNFTASVNVDSCGSNLPVYARRTVTVDGTTYTFRRGPVYL